MLASDVLVMDYDGLGINLAYTVNFSESGLGVDLLASLDTIKQPPMMMLYVPVIPQTINPESYILPSMSGFTYGILKAPKNMSLNTNFSKTYGKGYTTVVLTRTPSFDNESQEIYYDLRNTRVDVEFYTTSGSNRRGKLVHYEYDGDKVLLYYVEEKAYPHSWEFYADKQLDVKFYVYNQTMDGTLDTITTSSFEDVKVDSYV